MNNKLFHIIAFAGILTCSSCSETTKEDPIIEQERVPMTFTVAVEQTRAYISSDVTEIPVDSKFLLSVSYQKQSADGGTEKVSLLGPDYVYAKVTDAGLVFEGMSETDVLNEEFYWPDDPNAEVEVYAYYSESDITRILSSSNTVHNTWFVCPMDPTYDCLAVGLKLKTSEAKGKPIPLIFKHILSKVSFKVKPLDDYDYKISLIKIIGTSFGSFDPKSLYDENVAPWVLDNRTGEKNVLWKDFIVGNPNIYDAITDNETPIRAYLIPATYTMKVEYAYTPKVEGDALSSPQWTSIEREGIEITLAPGKEIVINLGLVSDQLNIGGDNTGGPSAD